MGAKEEYAYTLSKCIERLKFYSIYIAVVFFLQNRVVDDYNIVIQLVIVVSIGLKAGIKIDTVK